MSRDDDAARAVLDGKTVQVRITRTETLEIDVALDPEYPEIGEDLENGTMSVGDIASEYAYGSRDWEHEDTYYEYTIVG